MKVHVEYTGQLRAALRHADDHIDLPGGAGWKELIHAITERHGEKAREMLLSEAGGPEGVLCFVGDEQVEWDEPPALTDGAKVTLMSPIAGG